MEKKNDFDIFKALVYLFFLVIYSLIYFTVTMKIYKAMSPLPFPGMLFFFGGIMWLAGLAKLQRMLYK